MNQRENDKYFVFGLKIFLRNITMFIMFTLFFTLCACKLKITKHLK